MMVRLGNNIVKLLLASLFCGLALAQLGITADAIFEELGIEADEVYKTVGSIMRMIIPPIATGSLIAIPVWIAMSLFRSPKE